MNRSIEGNDDERRPLHGMVTFRKLSALMRMPRYSGIQFTEGLGWRLLRQPKPKQRPRYPTSNRGY